jgi:hypothetical protein
LNAAYRILVRLYRWITFHRTRRRNLATQPPTRFVRLCAPRRFA